MLDVGDLPAPHCRPATAMIISFVLGPGLIGRQLSSSTNLGMLCQLGLIKGEPRMDLPVLVKTPSSPNYAISSLEGY